VLFLVFQCLCHCAVFGFSTSCVIVLCFVFKTRDAAAAQEWRDIRSWRGQLATDALSARCLSHLLLQSLEGHPYLGEGTTFSICVVFTWSL